jgi:adenylate kinase family enzyme
VLISISSVAIDLLHRTYQPEEAGIAFLYCDYQERKQHTALNLISSLVQQLVQRQAVIPEVVTAFRTKALSRHTRPKVEHYSNLLHSMLDQFPRTFVVIDALDEYLEKDGSRTKLLEQLRLLHHKVNLLVTSRHLAALDTEFEADAILEVRANDEDINRYLRFQIYHNRNLVAHVGRSPQLEDEIVTRISERAQGM